MKQKVIRSLSVCVFLSACSTVEITQRYHVIESPTTVREYYADLGVDLSRVDSSFDLTRELKPGDKVYVPYEIIYPEPPDALAQKGLPQNPILKLAWPVNQAILGEQFTENKEHKGGISLVAPEGTSVFAADAGKVIYADDQIAGYGNMIVLKHLNGLITVYAHNKRNLVRKGQKVSQGDRIALLGKTGHATHPKLHFEVRKNKSPVNPLLFLPKKEEMWLSRAKPIQNTAKK